MAIHKDVMKDSQSKRPTEWVELGESELPAEVQADLTDLTPREFEEKYAVKPVANLESYEEAYEVFDLPVLDNAFYEKVRHHLGTVTSADVERTGALLQGEPKRAELNAVQGELWRLVEGLTSGSSSQKAEARKGLEDLSRQISTLVARKAEETSDEGATQPRDESQPS